MNACAHNQKPDILPYSPENLWRNSYIGGLAALARDQADMIKNKLFAGRGFNIRWPEIIRVLVILDLTFMPLRPLWWTMTPLLLLLWATGPVNDTRPSPTGWLFLGSVLAVGSFLGPGFPTVLPVLWRFGPWFLMAWLAGRTITTELRDRILRYLVYSSLIWVTIGFWQLFSGAPTPIGWLGPEQAAIIPARIYSVFGNPNVFALYLLTILGFSQYLDVKSPFKLEKRLMAGIAFLVLAALYFTYSRMAWSIAIILLTVRFAKYRRRFGLLAVGAGILSLLYLPGFKARIFNLAAFNDSSFRYRLQIWGGTLQGLRDYWLWGAGPGGFSKIYPQYKIGQSGGQHAHQFYLQFWLEYGIFGFSAFLAILKRVFQPAWKRCFQGPQMLSLAPAAFLIYGLSETWYIHPFSGGYFWFLVGIMQVGCQMSRVEGRE